MRIGLAPFPISPRNSPAAIAHLITNIHARYLLIGAEQTIQELASHVFKIMDESGAQLPHVTIMPAFEDLYLPDEYPLRPLPPVHLAMNDPALIMHSSGRSQYKSNCSFGEIIIGFQDQPPFPNLLSGRITDISCSV